MLYKLICLKYFNNNSSRKSYRICISVYIYGKQRESGIKPRKHAVNEFDNGNKLRYGALVCVASECLNDEKNDGDDNKEARMGKALIESVFVWDVVLDSCVYRYAE